MSGAEVLVLFAGAAGIAWTNWWFFLAGGRRGTAIAGTAGGIQEIEVAVEGGYEPSALRVRAGTPVRLVFHRRERSSCSEEVVLPDFGIRRFLPAFERTPVEFTPTEPGTYEFSCGMGMLRGRIDVVEGEA